MTTSVLNYRPDFTANKDNRVKLQSALLAAGALAVPPYDCGPDGADGTIGSDTGDAIVRFRKDHGLNEAAVIDTLLLRALNLESEPTVNISTLFGSIFNGLLGNLLNWTLVQSYIRNALVSVGGGLVTQGILTGGQLNDGVGALMVLIGLIWSVLNANRKAQMQQFVQQVTDHPAITVVPAVSNAIGVPIITVPSKAA